MLYPITPMQSVDADGKAYVHYQSWQETYAGLIDPAYLQAHTLEKCMRIARRWPDNLLVAKDGDRVIGFAGYGKYRDDSLPDCGEIHALYVLRDYHHRRVGYGLLSAAMERLAAYPRVALWVLSGNENAIRFYERYGFVPDGTQQTILLGTPNTELRMIYTRTPGL